MPRGSDKHTSRLDENLDHDTRPLTQGAPLEARAQEARAQEGEADDEPTPDSLLNGDRGVADPDMLTHDEVEARSVLATHLRPSVWPADREALLASARETNAPAWLLDQLALLPDGTFTHTEAVWEAMGGRVEFRM
ncbi:MAG TPA: DUF2795 domain-containing protein [Acidimicrobiales bacterium]|nr:DUF2795 domain-containing protein [Acidimicrobiales bacterium]